MSRSRSMLGAVGLAAGAIAVLGAAVAATAAVTAVVFARRVVTPPVHFDEDVRIVRVDLPSGEIVLGSTPETTVDGRYGLWFDHDAGYARLGMVVDVDDHVVRRRIEGVDFGRLDRAHRGRISGAFHLGPWELGFPYEDVVVPTPLGPAPAWFVPASTDSSDWIIQVHGRGAKRQEGLRAVSPARSAGWNTLLITYRNDGEAPESEDRRYGLGGTEWEDVAAAVRFATERGARRVVIMGWSMGGAISMQTVFRAADVRDAVVGIVLDSPVVDWVDILRFQGRLLGLPNAVGDMVTGVLGAPVTGTFTGLAAPIDLESLDAVARADELAVPMLLMHSVDDGFVPIDGSRRLAQARDDLVQFEEFTGAKHARLWNHDPVRWSALVEGWLRDR